MNNIKKDLSAEVKDAPFKTTFKITMGFYFAQFVASILGLLTIGGILGIIGLILFLLREK